MFFKSVLFIVLYKYYNNLWYNFTLLPKFPYTWYPYSFELYIWISDVKEFLLNTLYSEQVSIWCAMLAFLKGECSR